jgi:hypothetical protein
MAFFAGTASAEPTTANQQANDTSFAASVAEAAQRFAIPASWIDAIIRVESGGDPRAVSPKGALGLMQLMPATWGEIRSRYGLGSDPFDIHDNILAGTAYLRDMLDRYGSSGFLAAYHAGPGRYEKYRDRNRPLPPETQAYVATLQPLLDKHGDDPIALTAVIAPHGWRKAPLFTARQFGPGSVDLAPHQTSLQNKSTAAVMWDVSSLSPHAGGLFVALSMQGQRP